MYYCYRIIDVLNIDKHTRERFFFYSVEHIPRGLSHPIQSIYLSPIIPSIYMIYMHYICSRWGSLLCIRYIVQSKIGRYWYLFFVFVFINDKSLSICLFLSICLYFYICLSLFVLYSISLYIFFSMLSLSMFISISLYIKIICIYISCLYYNPMSIIYNLRAYYNCIIVVYLWLCLRYLWW